MNALSRGVPASQAVDLVIEEAARLDAADWSGWLELWAAESLYWVPLDPAATDPRLEQSLACEDRLLLAVRVERMKSVRAWSLRPMPRAQRILQPPRVESVSAGGDRASVRTPFLYTESRADRPVQLSGVLRHEISLGEGGARIVRKRIDLTDIASGLPAIFLPI
jgi:3-phenylpropionate/cinnamic acid dioxygenase small subunit